MAESEAEYMQKHPPSCVGADAAPAPVELRDLIQGKYGSNTSVFGLLCSCGENQFAVSVPDDGLGPVVVKCARCALQRTVFDPQKHGYDGVLGHNEETEVSPPSPRSCPKCRTSTFGLATGFQYSGETDILEEDDLAIKPEDLFGWFVLAGRCTSCGESSVLADVECA